MPVMLEDTRWWGSVMQDVCRGVIIVDVRLSVA